MTGAIGAALLARDEIVSRNGDGGPTRFRGFDLRTRQYAAKSFICQACPNLCEINRVTIGDEPPIFYGARCDMYDRATKRSHNGADVAGMPDLFAERQLLLLGDYIPAARREGRLRVGMPRTLYFYDLFPYWRTFFDDLGMDIVLSEPTNPATARRTKELAAAETCYPAKLVYGHVAELLEQDLDILFLPTIINRENVAHGQDENTYCPFIRATGFLAAATLDLTQNGIRPVMTPLHMQWERFKQQDLERLAHELGVSAKQVRQADAQGLAAQQAFYAALAANGHRVLDSLTEEQPSIVVVGRPYNTADLGVSLDLPQKLRHLGVLPIPLDFLALDQVDLGRFHPDMFWRCGQDILAGAEIIRNDPRLFALYVTSFGCGPDSFIISYFRRMMAGKPYLELELDDHTADAGILTRCEAFVESLLASRNAR